MQEKLFFQTRNQVAPANRPNVLAAFHLHDKERVQREVFSTVLSLQDCAIRWYLPELRLTRDIEEEIGETVRQAAMLLVPVTEMLLQEVPAVVNCLLYYAGKHHVPLLPVLLEKVPDASYARLFGDAHYIAAYQVSATELPFDRKLQDRLQQCLVSDDERKKIQACFRKKVFISYRKKDRRLVQALMKRIHTGLQNIDIALWYDEYLTPGESFTQEISEWIRQSDCFLMAVTGNTTEADNYIIRHEYPDAMRAGKPIYPVLLEEVDRTLLEKCFPGIPQAVYPDESLEQLFDDPEHDTRSYSAETVYYLGLAYLNGVWVETDLPKGVNAVRASAEAGCIPAMQMMSRLYRLGRGVPRDLEESSRWQDRILNRLCLLYKSHKTAESEIIAELIFSISLEQFNQSLSDGMPEIAKNYAKTMIRICDEVSETLSGDTTPKALSGWIRWLKYGAQALASMGDVICREDDPTSLQNGFWYADRSCTYLERALKLLQLPAAGELPDREECKEGLQKALVINLQHDFDLAEKCGDTNRMQKLIIWSDKVLNELDEPCEKHRRLWLIHKSQVAKIALMIDTTERALFHYNDCLVIGDNIFEEGDGLIRLEQGLVCDRIADLLMREGKLDDMRQIIERGYAYRQELLQYYPDDHDVLYGISQSMVRMGHYYVHCRDLAAALQWYEKTLRLCMRLAQEYPSAAAEEQKRYILQCIELLQQSMQNSDAKS